MKTFFAIYFFAIVAVVIVLGFRGQKSDKPPLWVFPDMDNQPRYDPQAANNYFPNRMDDRPRPRRTALRGQGWERKEVFSEDYGTQRYTNTDFFQGQGPDGELTEGFPLPVTNELMQLGREKYQIFCTVCHGEAGNGRGVTSQYGIIATNMVTDVYRERPNGNLFQTITHGYNSMYGYGDKITPRERWAIILYVRALQQAAGTQADELPASAREALGL